jgi:hypothetical protein
MFLIASMAAVSVRAERESEAGPRSRVCTFGA